MGRKAESEEKGGAFGLPAGGPVKSTFTVSIVDWEVRGRSSRVLVAVAVGRRSQEQGMDRGSAEAGGTIEGFAECGGER